MGLFAFFNRKKNESAVPSNQLSNFAVCYMCGMIYDDNSNVCPHCGAKSFDVYEYLQSKGLKQYADRYCDILVQVNDEPVLKCSLLGKQNDSDVLRLLQKNNYLDGNNRNRFIDWPSAGLRVYKAACVCELEKNKIYHVYSQDNSTLPQNMCLYGCPNAKSINNFEIRNQIEIRVVDYEK